MVLQSVSMSTPLVEGLTPEILDGLTATYRLAVRAGFGTELPAEWLRDRLVLRESTSGSLIVDDLFSGVYEFEMPGTLEELRSILSDWGRVIGEDVLRGGS